MQKVSFGGEVGETRTVAQANTCEWTAGRDLAALPEPTRAFTGRSAESSCEAGLR